MSNTKVDTVTRYSPLEVVNYLHLEWKTRNSVNIVGEPSTVKSVGVEDFSKATSEAEGRIYFPWVKRSHEEKMKVMEDPGKYFVFADFRASETDIGELRLQDISSELNYLTYKYGMLFQALSTDVAMGVLFFDEMNLAPNMIKAQFYKLINDKAIGDIPLSKNVMCVSAGNEAEHARGVTADPVPLVLRRSNIFVRPLDHEEFSDYAIKTGHSPHIVGYLAFQPHDTHNIKYDLPDSVGQPCPRTWSRLSEVMNANEHATLEQIRMAATGWVGQAVATKFYSYVKSAQTINLDEIIRKPELIRRFEDDEKNISLVYAIMSGLVDKYRQDKKKYIKPVFEVVNELRRTELGTFLFRSARSLDPKAFMKLGADETIVPKHLMDKLVDRYARFLIPN